MEDDSRKACGREDLVAHNLEKYSLPQYHVLPCIIIVFIVNVSIISLSLEWMFSEGWSLACLDYSCTTSVKGCVIIV